jgi:hypothetical protein
MFGQYGDQFTSLVPARQCSVQAEDLWSMILNKRVRVKVSPQALREIDRKGGLDEYLMFTDDSSLGGWGSVGVELKKRIVKRLNERFPQDGIAVKESDAGLIDWRKALDNQFWDTFQK